MKPSIDSAVVADGAFKMTGKAGKDDFLAVNIDGEDWFFLMFNDGTPVQIDVAKKTVTGSDLNNTLTACDLKNTEAYGEYNDFIQAFLALPKEEQAAQEAEFIQQYQAKIQDSLLRATGKQRFDLFPEGGDLIDGTGLLGAQLFSFRVLKQ
ncbi:MAG: DUF4369 domain-containing protein [Bacteroidales bacterium]|nr:DUF4369 domain-containing protein [Bacteroidales bacterium]